MVSPNKKMLTQKELKARALARTDVKAEYDRLDEEFNCRLELRLVKKAKIHKAQSLSSRSTRTTRKRSAG